MARPRDPGSQGLQPTVGGCRLSDALSSARFAHRPRERQLRDTSPILALAAEIGSEFGGGNLGRTHRGRAKEAMGPQRCRCPAR